MDPRKVLFPGLSDVYVDRLARGLGLGPRQRRAEAAAAAAAAATDEAAAASATADTEVGTGDPFVNTVLKIAILPPSLVVLAQRGGLRTPSVWIDDTVGFVPYTLQQGWMSQAPLASRGVNFKAALDAWRRARIAVADYIFERDSERNLISALKARGVYDGILLGTLPSPGALAVVIARCLSRDTATPQQLRQLIAESGSFAPGNDALTRRSRAIASRVYARASALIRGSGRGADTGRARGSADQNETGNGGVVAALAELNLLEAELANVVVPLRRVRGARGSIEPRLLQVLEREWRGSLESLPRDIQDQDNDAVVALEALRIAMQNRAMNDYGFAIASQSSITDMITTASLQGRLPRARQELWLRVLATRLAWLQRPQQEVLNLLPLGNADLTERAHATVTALLDSSTPVAATAEAAAATGPGVSPGSGPVDTSGLEYDPAWRVVSRAARRRARLYVKRQRDVETVGASPSLMQYGRVDWLAPLHGPRSRADAKASPTGEPQHPDATAATMTSRLRLEACDMLRSLASRGRNWSRVTPLGGSGTERPTALDWCELAPLEGTLRWNVAIEARFNPADLAEVVKDTQNVPRTVTDAVTVARRRVSEFVRDAADWVASHPAVSVATFDRGTPRGGVSPLVPQRLHGTDIGVRFERLLLEPLALESVASDGGAPYDADAETDQRIRKALLRVGLMRRSAVGVDPVGGTGRARRGVAYCVDGTLALALYVALQQHSAVMLATLQRRLTVGVGGDEALLGSLLVSSDHTATPLATSTGSTRSGVSEGEQRDASLNRGEKADAAAVAVADASTGVTGGKSMAEGESENMGEEVEALASGAEAAQERSVNDMPLHAAQQPPGPGDSDVLLLPRRGPPDDELDEPDDRGKRAKRFRAEPTQRLLALRATMEVRKGLELRLANQLSNTVPRGRQFEAALRVHWTSTDTDDGGEAQTHADELRKLRDVVDAVSRSLTDEPASILWSRDAAFGGVVDGLGSGGAGGGVMDAWRARLARRVQQSGASARTFYRNALNDAVQDFSSAYGDAEPDSVASRASGFDTLGASALLQFLLTQRCAGDAGNAGDEEEDTGGPGVPVAQDVLADLRTKMNGGVQYLAGTFADPLVSSWMLAQPETRRRVAAVCRGIVSGQIRASQAWLDKLTHGLDTDCYAVANAAVRLATAIHARRSKAFDASGTAAGALRQTSAFARGGDTDTAIKSGYAYRASADAVDTLYDSVTRYATQRVSSSAEAAAVVPQSAAECGAFEPRIAVDAPGGQFVGPEAPGRAALERMLLRERRAAVTGDSRREDRRAIDVATDAVPFATRTLLVDALRRYDTDTRVTRLDTELENLFLRLLSVGIVLQVPPVLDPAEPAGSVRELHRRLGTLLL